MYPLRSLLTPLVLFVFSSCNSQNLKTNLTGKLVFTHVSDLRTYEFATKKEKTVLKEGLQPFVSQNGDIYFVSNAFPKRLLLIRKSNSSYSQFGNVLDMSSDNPQYKKQLDDYSVIKGTGISAVLDHMAEPRISPNGKYLSVTIFGYPHQAFEKNCVAVFDLTSGQLVKKFEDKYYGNWLADGRLLMSGSYKSASLDDKVYNSPSVGIFIADAQLENIKRIDNGLNDPAPYHATASPDGKKIAFMLNSHLWVMDIDGKNMKQLTDADNDNVESFPAWSPDGKNIACWCYKTFERSYYTAIAIVPANANTPIELTNKAAVWPRDANGDRISGGSNQFCWIK